MELSGKEKKLQALFSELKTADEEAAPRFARVWNRATPARRAFAFNPAFVAAMAFVVCAVLAIAVWSRYRQPATNEVVHVETPPAATGSPAITPTVPLIVESQALDPSKKNITPRRNRPAGRRNSIQMATNRKLTRDAKAITDWESPTSALLSSSSDKLFSSLPQLNENASGLQSFLPSRPN